MRSELEGAPLSAVWDNYEEFVIAMSTNSTASMEEIKIVRLIDFLLGERHKKTEMALVGGEAFLLYEGIIPRKIDFIKNCAAYEAKMD